ncbi:photosystem I reaction center subunit XII [Candidatus Gracilibacteria bacterium]|nr:photosystem I reaction center subunit XII [Candidatus Gracilibacteria bacterium]NJM88186.1 photosystem I reaction center subunit XII [Hydrococcus sp. RU_2_2]NJP19604.1 photosystem I reaction center subunit XII [Hydrococcus sp. CRU_1_1]NJQ98244.1 photosystem I reaction center subunit XII [Hydrococcus sp. CSU_1_8]
MAITVAASRLGTSAFDGASPVELRPNWSQDDAQAVIRAVYRQVLGNDYIMDSERIKSAESLLCNGSISVREFVRAVAKSELYKSKFFYNNFQTRTIELNIKHLLGRAPYDESEFVYHLDLYETQGYEADIDSYIDSEEYIESFGENIVPYYRGFETQTGQKTVGFTRMFRLYRGYANSDRSQLGGGSPRLAGELGQNTASAVVSPGNTYKASRSRNLGVGTTPTKALGGSLPFGSESKIYRIEVAGMTGAGYPRVRRGSKAFFVSYEQLNSTLEQINRQGGKVASITPASL